MTTHADQLTRALFDIAARGERPHCGDSGTGGLWLSEVEDERAEAVKLCRGCPVLTSCGQAAMAHGERIGVTTKTKPSQGSPQGRD